MSDSQCSEAEPALQQTFSFSNIFNSLLLAGAIAAFAFWIRDLPNREPGPSRLIPVSASPVDTGNWTIAGARLAGAWRLRAEDQRFGGLSALVFDRGALLALSDSGVTVRFPPPARRTQQLPARIADLPDGPGDPRLKASRDSEALVGDGDGNWWVAFEVHHWLWIYLKDFATGFWAVNLEEQGLATNKGVEALVRLDANQLAAFPEAGHDVLLITLDPRRVDRIAVDGLGGDVSDAAMLPDGRLLILRRAFGLDGISARIDLVTREGKRWRALPVASLSTGSLSNFEGVAASPLANGGTRLWLVSDDDFRPGGRTLLVALDLPRQVEARR